MSATTGAGAMRRERTGAVAVLRRALRYARLPVLAVALWCALLSALGSGCATGPHAARVPFLVETPTPAASAVRFAWPASVDLGRAHLLLCAYEPTTRDAFCVLFDEAVQRQPPSGSGTF